jgi:hypothetical protein
LPTAKTEAPHSLLWLAAIQIVERKQNLPDLAPKPCFIAAQAIKRETANQAWLLLKIAALRATNLLQRNIIYPEALIKFDKKIKTR